MGCSEYKEQVACVTWQGRMTLRKRALTGEEENGHEWAGSVWISSLDRTTLQTWGTLKWEGEAPRPQE